MKTFEIELRPGSKLSETFGNRRDCYKVVETEHVLAYVVTSGGRAGVASVYPLYRADVHFKAGKTWHLVSSYEQGPRLNDYTFIEDYAGCTFASIASQSLNALEERHRTRQRAKAPKKPKQKRPR